MLLAVGFSYDLSHAAEVSFLVYVIFLMKWFWTLSVAFPASIERMMRFFLHSISVVYGTPLQYSYLENPMDRRAW